MTTTKSCTAFHSWDYIVKFCDFDWTISKYQIHVRRRSYERETPSDFYRVAFGSYVLHVFYISFDVFIAAWMVVRKDLCISYSKGSLWSCNVIMRHTKSNIIAVSPQASSTLILAWRMGSLCCRLYWQLDVEGIMLATMILHMHFECPRYNIIPMHALLVWPNVVLVKSPQMRLSVGSQVSQFGQSNQLALQGALIQIPSRFHIFSEFHLIVVNSKLKEHQQIH